MTKLWIYFICNAMDLKKTVMFRINSGLVLWVAMILTLATSLSGSSATEVLHPAEEYCEGSAFKATCSGESERIMIVTAQYGRMHEGKCISGDNMDCHTDVLGILDERCSGRKLCSVNVVDVFQNIPENKRRCSKNFRGFLEVSYKCVKVLKPESCIIDLKTIVGTEGYMPTTIANKTECGSSVKPWRVQIATEQRVNLFLYDFAVFTRNPDDLIGGTPSTCKVYAVIKEEKVRNSDTLCGQYQRQKLVYTSMSDEIEIRIMEKFHHFFIKYEVMGCGGLRIPTGGWVKRNGDKADIGCDGTDTQWTLHCKGNKWQGESGNCTDSDGVPLIAIASLSDTGDEIGFGTLFGSHWLTYLAISAIAITVAICILVAGIIYIKRKHVYLSQQNGLAEDPNSLSYKYGTGVTLHSNQHGHLGQSIYNEHGVPYRVFDPNDHEYLKTIERQRLMLIGQHPQQHFATINNHQFNWATDPPSSHHQFITNNTVRPDAATEHIYELPKFETDPLGKNIPSQHQVVAIPPPPPPPVARIHGFDFEPPLPPPQNQPVRVGGVNPSQNNNNMGGVSNTGDNALRNVNNRSV